MLRGSKWPLLFASLVGCTIVTGDDRGDAHDTSPGDSTSGEGEQAGSNSGSDGSSSSSDDEPNAGTALDPGSTGTSGGAHGSTGTSGEAHGSTSSSETSMGGAEHGEEGDEPGVQPHGDCDALISDPSINWRDSTLTTDQEIVACLAHSLGAPVGYGQAARGGYDPSGGSRLTVITRQDGISVEEQIREAVAGDEPNWIVFDKRDFAEPSEVALYRLYCDAPDVQDALGSSAEVCRDHGRWCAENGVPEDQCLEVFFNERLNRDLSISNVRIGSNKTIDGRQSEAYFLFSGFAIGSDSDGAPVDTASSVILTNLRFQGAGHTEDHALDPDMIRSTGASHNIWIHQNTFDLTGDSAFDVKVGAYDITMSFNLVHNVLRAALHGSSDSRTINEQITTTMHHNAFITTDDLYDTFGNTARRVPLLRRGTTHMFNNIFYNYRKDVLSVRVGARVVFEDNMFLAHRDAVGSDDIDYYLENLLRDFREGALEITGSHVWMSDASCALDPSDHGDLSASFGSAPDPSLEYDDASRRAIDEHRLPAGIELADYVFATAGKGGQTPFNAPSGVDKNGPFSRRACP